jgi:hypothetical protein
MMISDDDLRSRYGAAVNDEAAIKDEIQEWFNTLPEAAQRRIHPDTLDKRFYPGLTTEEAETVERTTGKDGLVPIVDIQIQNREELEATRSEMNRRHLL